jgi:hypothetical protein
MRLFSYCEVLQSGTLALQHVFAALTYSEKLFTPAFKVHPLELRSIAELTAYLVCAGSNFR